MAKQSIGLGSSTMTEQVITLRVGGDKVNDNFNEIYTALGNGTDLQITTKSFINMYCNGTLLIIDLSNCILRYRRYISRYNSTTWW